MSKITFEEQTTPSAPSSNKVSIYPKADGKMYSMDDQGVESLLTNEGAAGDVVGPATATNNAVARYDLTTGKLIKDSGVTIDDANNMKIAGDLDVVNPNITVNKDGDNTSAQGAGLTIERAGSDGSLIYDDTTTSKFKAGVIGAEVELADISSTQEFTNKSISADQIKLSTLGTPTYTESQQATNLFNSVGVISWDGVVDDGDGSITVGAGSGLIRATNSDLAELNFFDWTLESGANVNLADNDLNYIYVEYNAGTPRVIATTTLRSDSETNIYLANIYRENTTLHITAIDYVVVTNSAALVDRRNKELTPFAHVSGGAISETGTRNIAITEYAGWHGLIPFSIADMDTSVADTFSYSYQNGVGGFVEIASQTQINNTQYDDGTGTLATLANNQYGVHWVYRGLDGDTYVLFGRGSYTLSEAQATTAPSNVPAKFENHAIIYGRIIIQENTAIFTEISSAFDTPFVGSSVGNHNELSGLQGGTVAEYYHLTAAEHAAMGDVVGPVGSTDNTVPRFDGTTGKVLQSSNISIDDLDNITGADHIEAQSIEVFHTAIATDDHAIEIDVDAAGFGDVKGLDIVYVTGPIAQGDDEAAILVNFDESLSTGGDLVGLEVLATDGSASVHGLLAGVGVGPIRQLSGSFEDMTSALVNATDRLVEFTNVGNDVQIFVADNDSVTIGFTSKFEEIEFLFSVFSSQTIRPRFEYSTGIGTWTVFTPTDGTNGMRNNGVIAWLDSDIPAWTTGLNSEYLIRITRTRNSLTTPPTESLVQIATALEYFWDKDAKICANQLKIGDGIFATTILDEDDLVSDLDTAIPSQQSVKAYVDNLVRYEDLSTYVGEDAGVLDDGTANNNTGVGWHALTLSTTGYNNAGLGYGVMRKITTGHSNCAFGYQSLYNAQGANTNTALGAYSLNNATSNSNTGIGYSSLTTCTSGQRNTGVGYLSGRNSTGSDNTSIGHRAGYGASTASNSRNTFLGANTAQSLTTGSDNILIGYNVDLPTGTTNNHLNIGGALKGDLSTGLISFTSGVSVSAILDEDDLVSDSATALATQQSIKKYVDTSRAVRSALVGTAIDFSLNDVVRTKTLTANTTLSLTNPILDKTITLEVDGNFTLTFPASVNIVNGSYDGTVQNWVMFYCVDAATPTYLATIMQEL